MRPRVPNLVLLAICLPSAVETSACTFKVNVNTTSPDRTMMDGGADSETGHRDSGEDGSTAPFDAAEEHDAWQDAASTDAEADESADAAPEIKQHASCSTPRPEAWPKLPIILVDATGRPAFDLWRDLSCAFATDYPLCTEGHLASTAAWLCNECIMGGGDKGICSPRSTAEGSELLTTQDGACRALLPSEAKKRACCDELPGFDCRAWPFQSDSKPGQACARHEDCEPGLVCGALGDLQGVCTCPKSAETPPEQPASCRIGSGL